MKTLILILNWLFSSEREAAKEIASELVEQQQKGFDC